MVKQEPIISHRLPKWYFGGCASATAALLTHPLDLLKVHLQTSKSSREFKLLPRVAKIIELQGVIALYNGLTASLFRQLTYSTVRFGLYEILKQSFTQDTKPLDFHQKVLFAAISGAAGGFVVSKNHYTLLHRQKSTRRTLTHYYRIISTYRLYQGNARRCDKRSNAK